MADRLGRLTPRTLTNDCYDVLKRSIMDLELPPGTLLVENQIAERFGISKTPVREAIARLSGEGVVVTDRRRRSYVGGLTLESIQELYQARLLIEPVILRAVAPSLSHADIETLYQLLQEAENVIRVETPIEYVDSSKRFHMFFVRHSGNEYLQRLMEDLFVHIHRVRAAVRFTEQEFGQRIEPSHGLEEHRRIVDAVANGDTDGAARHLEEHIDAFLQRTNSAELRIALDRLSTSTVSE